MLSKTTSLDSGTKLFALLNLLSYQIQTTCFASFPHTYTWHMEYKVHCLDGWHVAIDHADSNVEIEFDIEPSFADMSGEVCKYRCQSEKLA